MALIRRVFVRSPKTSACVCRYGARPPGLHSIRDGFSLTGTEASGPRLAHNRQGVKWDSAMRACLPPPAWRFNPHPSKLRDWECAGTACSSRRRFHSRRHHGRATSQVAVRCICQPARHCETAPASQDAPLSDAGSVHQSNRPTVTHRPVMNASATWTSGRRSMSIPRVATSPAIRR